MSDLDSQLGPRTRFYVHEQVNRANARNWHASLSDNLCRIKYGRP